MELVTKAASPLLSQLDLACWNCGGGHGLPDCTFPKNREKIYEGKKEMQEAMKKSRRNADRGASSGNHNGASSGKFRKPNADENNRHTIGGNTIFYHKKTDRWITNSSPLGAIVMPEAVVVTLVPLAMPTLVSVPPAQANTGIDGGRSNNFTKDEFSKMKSNLNMIMAIQIIEYAK
jgi:hypothetical protein